MSTLTGSLHRLPRERSAGRWLQPLHGDIAATSQTFTAGRVLLLQFTVPIPVLADALTYVVGGTSNGNVTGGIIRPVSPFADSADAGVVVAESASTAQGTINDHQVLAFTAAVWLAPGTYYAALEGSSATGTYMRVGNQRQAPGLGAFYDRAGGYGALTTPTPTTTDNGSAMPGLLVRVAG